VCVVLDLATVSRGNLRKLERRVPNCRPGNSVEHRRITTRHTASSVELQALGCHMLNGVVTHVSGGVTQCDATNM
jgi:hypothetical protein